MKAELNKNKIEKYLTSVDDALTASEEAVADIKALEDDADYTRACELLFDVSEYQAAVTEEKDKVIGAAKLIIQTVGGWFSPREKRIDAHKERVKALVRDYNIACEARRQETLKAAMKVAKVDPSRAREMNAEAEAALPPRVKGIAFVGKLDVQIVDESKIPDGYWKRVVDPAKLKAAAEAGEVVPGVLVVDNRTVRVTPSQREE